MATKSKVSTEEWIEELKGISVLELSERIKALEEEFGVSATAVAAAAPAAGGPAAGEDGAEEESTTVDVVLTAPVFSRRLRRRPPLGRRTRTASMRDGHSCPRFECFRAD